MQINLLGRFEVIVDNERIDQKISKAKKGWTLIKYLLMHLGETVPNYELYDLLWGGEQSNNPESALKTLVSRMRAFFNTCVEGLGDLIETDHGGYRWNTHVDAAIDVIEFENLCAILCDEGTEYASEEDFRAKFSRMMLLYYGDLLPANAQEGWVISRSVSLHNIYIKTVYRYIEMLKSGEPDYPEVIRVCRIALEIEAFDEKLHLDLMDALMKMKRNNEALLQYKYATSMHFKYLGMQPPDGIQAFYKQIIDADRRLDLDIDSVRDELTMYDDSRHGAFVCEYSVFKEIYNLNMRNLERLGSSLFIALVMISNVDGQPMSGLKLDDIMGGLLEIMVDSLRKGDTITRHSASQYLLLLPTVTYESGKMVLERIKRLFYHRHPNSSILCNYRLGPVNERSAMSDT
jgi:DNA-binding SARP family transcriptional activator